MEVPVVSVDADQYLVCDPYLDRPATIVPLSQSPRFGETLRTLVSLLPGLEVDTRFFGSGRLGSLYVGFSDAVKSRMGWHARNQGAYDELSQQVHAVRAGVDCTLDLLVPALFEVSGSGFAIGGLVDDARAFWDGVPVSGREYLGVDYRTPRSVPLDEPGGKSWFLFREEVELRFFRFENVEDRVWIGRYYGVRTGTPRPVDVVAGPTTSPFR